MCISTGGKRSLTLTPRLPGGVAVKALRGQAASGAGRCGSTVPWDARRQRFVSRPQPGPLPLPRPLTAAPQQQPLAPAPMPLAPSGRPAPPTSTSSPSPNARVAALTGAAKKAAHHHRRNKHDLHVDHPYRDHAADAPTNEKHITRGGVTEPFPMKLHKMLDQIERDGYGGIVGWQSHGRCFVVHKQREFVDIVMPKYFKQTKFASFQRQLNLYGFSRLTAGIDRGGYYHELFLRGKQFLAHKIHRMRVKGTRVRMASSPDREPNFYTMPALCEGRMPCMSPSCCGVGRSPPPPKVMVAPSPPPGLVLKHPGGMFAQPCQQPTPPLSYTPPVMQQPVRVPYSQPAPQPAPAPVPTKLQLQPVKAELPPSAPKQEVSAVVSPTFERPILANKQLASSCPTVVQQRAPQPAPLKKHLPEIGEEVDDDDLDEIMFEGKVFHYLKPFTETPPSPEWKQPMPQINANSIPPLPESVPSFDTTEQRPLASLAAEPIPSQPVVVPGSPPAFCPPPPRATETVMKPLPPPPPLDVPPTGSPFELASRLAEMVYKKPVPVQPDPAPSSRDDTCKAPAVDLANSNFKINVNLGPDGKVDVNVEVEGVGHDGGNPVVSDDDSQGMSRHSSEASLAHTSQDKGGAGARNVDGEARGLSSSLSGGDLVLSEEKIGTEMESFFATLDSPLETDEEMNAYLADDIGFGYMIERVLQ